MKTQKNISQMKDQGEFPEKMIICLLKRRKNGNKNDHQICEWNRKI